MGHVIKIRNPDELAPVQGLIHDCYFDVADISFDSSSSALSFRFRRLVTRGKYGWRDFISTSKMSPAIECFLKINHVESYSINDAQKIGTYAFNVLDYNPSKHTIAVLTDVPIDIRIVVRDFEISVEVTDNAFEPTQWHIQELG